MVLGKFRGHGEHGHAFTSQERAPATFPPGTNAALKLPWRPLTASGGS